jgi:putative glutamine amidotransferase
MHEKTENNVNLRRTPGWLAFLLILIAAGLAAFPTATDAKTGWQCGLVYNQKQYQALVQGRDKLIPYRDAIRAHHGTIVVFHPGMEPRQVERFLSGLDGLLLPGGDDVDPAAYGEAPHPALEEVDQPLDRMQFHLIAEAERRKIPTLGICRGMQILNVALGGTLFQDLPSQHPQAGRVTHRIRRDGRSKPCFHPVYPTPGTPLHRRLGREAIVTNSSHHQAVKDLGRGLQILGRTADGVVEIISGSGDWSVFGVQFHPEKMRREQAEADLFFVEFVEHSVEYSKKRALEGKSR